VLVLWVAIFTFSRYGSRFIGYVVAVNLSVVNVLEVVLPEKQMLKEVLRRGQQRLGGSIEINCQQYPGQERFHSGGIDCA
jgi:hypothetical protein